MNDPLHERFLILVRRFTLPSVLVVMTLLAGWFVLRIGTPDKSVFKVSGRLDETHIFRTYDFTSDLPGTLHANLDWDTGEELQFRITDENGKIIRECSGTPPLELAADIRSTATYKLVVIGTRKPQTANFTLHAAANAIEIPSTDTSSLDNTPE